MSEETTPQGVFVNQTYTTGVRSTPRSMPVHWPEHGRDESFEEYRKRRTISNSLVRQMGKPHKQPPAVSVLDTSRFFLGAHTNPSKVRKSKPNMGQNPKFPKVRGHKPHNPTKPFVTLVGQNPRRPWKAGPSEKTE